MADEYVKFERKSNGHFYVWDRCFTTPLYDLNDPPLGLGSALVTVFGALTPIEITTGEDAAFVIFKNFLEGERQALVTQIADAVGP